MYCTVYLICISMQIFVLYDVKMIYTNIYKSTKYSIFYDCGRDISPDTTCFRASWIGITAMRSARCATFEVRTQIRIGKKLLCQDKNGCGSGPWMDDLQYSHLFYKHGDFHCQLEGYWCSQAFSSHVSSKCVCVYFRTWTVLIAIRLLVLNVTGSWNEPTAEIYLFATHDVSTVCLAKLRNCRNWPGNIALLISGAPRETCYLLRNSHALRVQLQHVWVVRTTRKDKKRYPAAQIEKASWSAPWYPSWLRFGTIQTIEYDPYRNSRICLVKYEAGMDLQVMTL